MSIWIRTQNSSCLMECSNFYYHNNDSFEGVKIKSGQFLIGKYEDKEQADFVLDLIEEHINRHENTAFAMPSIRETETLMAEYQISFTPMRKDDK